MARAHQVILLGVCCHAPHPVAVGVLGQAVGKLLGGPRLGAIEHDDVPALGKARHAGSVHGQEAQASLETPDDPRGRPGGWGISRAPSSCFKSLLSHAGARTSLPQLPWQPGAEAAPAIKVFLHSHSRSHFGRIFKRHAKDTTECSVKN